VVGVMAERWIRVERHNKLRHESAPSYLVSRVHCHTYLAKEKDHMMVAQGLRSTKYLLRGEALDVPHGYRVCGRGDWATEMLP